MTEYINSTLRSNDWGLYFTSPTYRECLVIFIIHFYGLRIQIQKLNHQRHINLIKEFEKSIVQILVTLVDWCTFMMDYDDIIEKEVTNAKVVPYKNETITKPERKEESKHPWDIAKEIIAEQNQAALAVKWGILPLETLMDEQFLSILHAVEEITDVTPLREAAIQLPKKIYEIVRQYEQLKEVPAELTDQFIFDISKTYFYSVIESLYRLIKTIQQGQRTSIISLANIVQEQRGEIEKYQALLKLPEKVRQLQLGMEVKMEKLKRHVNMHLERIDKKTSITSVTISEIRSQVHKIESTIEESYEKIPEPNSPSWIFPGDIVELHAPEDDIIFHDESDDETSTNREQQQEENLTISGETQGEHGNIPHGLSPPRQYVPAGAEGDEANSSTSTYGEEETVEEELANYFSNPSCRAANPELLEPVDSEEDWGDVSPVPLPPQTPQELHQQTARSEKRQRYLQRRRERRRQNWRGRNHYQYHLDHY